MAKNPLPTPEQLRQLLRYEPETGKLFWKERTSEWFESSWNRTAEANCRAWNTANAGREAFTTASRGYRQGSVLGISVRAHRVAWAIHHGSWPKNIDHINGDRGDNRASNLRDVETRENNKNLKIPRNNTSGHMGVYWHSRAKIWSARVQVNGESIHLGCFDSREAAVSARASCRAHGRVSP